MVEMSALYVAPSINYCAVISAEIYCVWTIVPDFRPPAVKKSPCVKFLSRQPVQTLHTTMLYSKYTRLSDVPHHMTMPLTSICWTLRSRKVASFLTEMRLLGPTQPIVVPRPPLSLITTSLLSRAFAALSGTCCIDEYGRTW